MWCMWNMVIETMTCAGCHISSMFTVCGKQSNFLSFFSYGLCCCSPFFICVSFTHSHSHDTLHLCVCSCSSHLLLTLHLSLPHFIPVCPRPIPFVPFFSLTHSLFSLTFLFFLPKFWSLPPSPSFAQSKSFFVSSTSLPPSQWTQTPPPLFLLHHVFFFTLCIKNPFPFFSFLHSSNALLAFLPVSLRPTGAYTPQMTSCCWRSMKACSQLPFRPSSLGELPHFKRKWIILWNEWRHVPQWHTHTYHWNLQRDRHANICTKTCMCTRLWKGKYHTFLLSFHPPWQKR